MATSKTTAELQAARLRKSDESGGHSQREKVDSLSGVSFHTTGLVVSHSSFRHLHSDISLVSHWTRLDWTASSVTHTHTLLWSVFHHLNF